MPLLGILQRKNMGIDLGSAAEAAAEAIIINELAGAGNSTANTSDIPKLCANCGSELTGAYCQNCGQSSHIHRSLLHMVEELLHGLFHFDTKAWRTIPALILRPGKLTKQYIAGKRTSFVSPLALFLFLIFLMFFVFSLTLSGPDENIINPTKTKEQITTEFETTKAKLAEQQISEAENLKDKRSVIDIRDDIHESKSELRILQSKLDALDGKEKTKEQMDAELAQAEMVLAGLLKKQNNETQDVSESGEINAASLAQEIAFARSDVKYFNKQLRRLNKQTSKEELKKDIKTKLKGNKATADSKPTLDASTPKTATGGDTNVDNEDAMTSIDDISDMPFFGKSIKHFKENQALTIYKMKKNAASCAFLLMPISLPFLWLLFAFRRRFLMFDHAVFSLYSLSFMSILLMAIAILSKFEFSSVAGILFFFAPPIHMFVQLRGAYDLGIWSTVWRTLALLFIALISLVIYAAVVTYLSA